jgi:hypothetical protein
MALTYLFECLFTDGTTLKQTAEDVSKTDPTKSAFFDVVQRKNDVVSFGINNKQHSYVVDLRDGHFEIDGVPFKVHTELPQENCIFRLIYFRRHQQNTTLGGKSSHTVVYHIGWQTTVDGKNYQQTISVE